MLLIHHFTKCLYWNDKELFIFTLLGRYCNVHHMTGNYMWDETSNKEFLIGTNPDSELPLWWNGSEPLWVTLQKLGKKVFMYFWPGKSFHLHKLLHLSTILACKCVRLALCVNIESLINANVTAVITYRSLMHLAMRPFKNDVHSSIVLVTTGSTEGETYTLLYWISFAERQ